MVIINNASGLTEAHYSGTNLTEIYVGSHLVWPVSQPPIVGDKLNYTISGSTYTIPCDSTSYIRNLDILNDMDSRGIQMREFSAITDVVIGDCVNELKPSCFVDCYSLSSATIPNSVTTIGYSSFNNCTSLQSIVIPSGVTSIGISTFNSNYELASVTLPDGLTTIGADAFYDALSLLNITIPSGVTSIGDDAFRVSYWTSQDQDKYTKMMNLKDNRVVTCLATTPPTLGTNAFSIISGNQDIAAYKIKVPFESVDAYKAAWSEFSSRIEGLGDIQAIP